MRTEQVYLVNWYSTIYHVAYDPLGPYMECGREINNPMIRIFGKGAEAWLKRNGYTLCGNCAREMKAWEEREAEK